MQIGTEYPHRYLVALRKESVDRNLLMWWQSNTTIKVALRKESMECFSF